MERRSKMFSGLLSRVQRAAEVYDTDVVDQGAALRTSHPDGVDAILDLVNGKDAITGDAAMLKAGGALVSTRYAADRAWSAEHRITPHSISSMENPLADAARTSRTCADGADGAITARVGSTFALDAAGEMLVNLHRDKLRANPHSYIKSSDFVHHPDVVSVDRYTARRGRMSNEQRTFG